jgi:hypothetical protein
VLIDTEELRRCSRKILRQRVDESWWQVIEQRISEIEAARV